MPVRGDGFCFLTAIDLVLCCDYNEVASVNNLASNILGHLAANGDYYKKFHTGDILRDKEDYFKFGNYCDRVVDLIIIITAKALNVHLSVHQKGPDGNIQVIEQTTDTRGREVYLKFMWGTQNPTKNHCGAFWLFDKPGQVFDHTVIVPFLPACS